MGILEYAFYMVQDPLIYHPTLYLGNQENVFYMVQDPLMNIQHCTWGFWNILSIWSRIP